MANMVSTHDTSKMNITLWIAQITLAAGFVWSAAMKLFQPTDKLADMWAWTADHAELVKLTGIVDLLAGMGLVLPALFHIQPKLTIYAAYGSVALMIAASIFHIARGETSQIGVNIFFALVAAFIAWGRQKKVPIASK